jgi:hypothetical protein
MRRLAPWLLVVGGGQVQGGWLSVGAEDYCTSAAVLSPTKNFHLNKLHNPSRVTASTIRQFDRKSRKILLT